MKDRKKLIPLVIALVVITGTTLYFEVFRHLGQNGDMIEGSGTIEVTEIDISTKLAGRVEKLPFEEGEQVKKGDLVVELEYDQLKAQQLQAEANLSNAQKNLNRVRDLFKSGSVSRSKMDDALTAYRVAKSQYDYIRASIDQAVLYAPVDGIVLEKNLEVGEMAFPGTPVVTIANLEKPWINIYVRETKLGLLKHGQKAEVFVDSFPDTPFSARVASISNKAEFTPKTIQTKEERVKLVYAVKLIVDNPGMKLKPGMPADAVVHVEEEK